MPGGGGGGSDYKQGGRVWNLSFVLLSLLSAMARSLYSACVCVRRVRCGDRSEVNSNPPALTLTTLSETPHTTGSHALCL